jgi:uncharacterized membrane protein
MSASLPLLGGETDGGFISGNNGGESTESSIICFPAGLVLIIGSVMSLIEFIKGRNDVATFRFAITLILGAIVMLLCTSGFETAAWYVLSIPIIIIIVFSLFVIFLLMKSSENTKDNTAIWDMPKPTLEQSYEYVFTGKGLNASPSK